VERLKFSKTALLALTPREDGKRRTVYDTETPKLALLITKTSAKGFYVLKRVGPSMAWVKLGSFPDMTVEQARTEAAKILGEFATGADPAKARRAIRGEPTFAEVFDRYLVEKKKRNGTHLTEKTKVNYSDVLRIYLGSIKNKKLSQITRTELKAIHAKASKKSHAQADRAIRIVSAAFNFAIDLELFDKISPANRIQKNEAIERDRFVMDYELPHMIEAINRSKQCDFLLLALLTGARRSNVQEMAWRDLDLNAGIWRLAMTKNGTPQNVTLSPEAIALLKMRKPSLGDSHFVFPANSKSGHLAEPKTSWETVRRRATTYRILELLSEADKLTEEERQQAVTMITAQSVKAEQHYRAIANTLKIDPATYEMTDIRIHDLRRTLGSWQAMTGASLQIIGKSLNHKTLQATQIYARLALSPVRQSVNTATAAMMEAAGIKQSATIIQGDTKLA
jgi:integrase